MPLETYGYMHFIGGYDAEFWIADLPPELMADDLHIKGARRLWGILNFVNDSCRRQSQNNHNNDRHDCPGHFNRVAAINLRRLFAIILGAAAEAHDRKDNQAEHDHKYGAGYCQHENGQ